MSPRATLSNLNKSGWSKACISATPSGTAIRGVPCTQAAVAFHYLDRLVQTLEYRASPSARAPATASAAKVTTTAKVGAFHLSAHMYAHKGKPTASYAGKSAGPFSLERRGRGVG